MIEGRLDDEIIHLQPEVHFGFKWVGTHISGRCKSFFCGLRVVCYKCGQNYSSPFEVPR